MANKPRHALQIKKFLELHTKPWLHMNYFNKDRALMDTPEHYKKFYYTWKFGPRAPVHYIPHDIKFQMIENEEVIPVRDIPLSQIIPDNYQQIFTGGETIIRGFTKKNKRFSKRTPIYWIPNIKSSVVYSEILDKRMEILCTRFGLSQIDKSYGLDNYLLRTPVQDLLTELPIKIRRALLLALTDRTLYPNDPAKRDYLIEQYKDCLIPRDELEWFGLNTYEARAKQELLEEVENELDNAPLKEVFRKQLVEFITNEKLEELKNEEENKELKQNEGKLQNLMGKINLNLFKKKGTK